MPTVPGPLLGQETGLPDSQWITEVRAALRDYAFYVADTKTADGVNGAIPTAASLPYRVTRPPVVDGTFACTVGGTLQTVITTGTPTSNQVLINYDTGEFYFSTAPGNGVALAWSHQSVKWRDQDIQDALYAGLRAMFPWVGKTYVDESIQIQVNVWDYQLPAWGSDPRARIDSVEIKDPYILTQNWQPLYQWKPTGIGRIHITHAEMYSPVARLRIQGWGPYQNLGDLEPQLRRLPNWYAQGVLLLDIEAPRIRADTVVPLTQEGSQQPGLSAELGRRYLDMFEQELKRLARITRNRDVRFLPYTTRFHPRFV